MKFNKKGAVTSDSVIKVVIGIIFLVAVAIPVTLNIMNNITAVGSGSGVNQTLFTGVGVVIANLIPVFLAIAGIVLVSRLSN